MKTYFIGFKVVDDCNPEPLTEEEIIALFNKDLPVGVTVKVENFCEVIISGGKK